jgi:hypothetical protein
VAYTKKQFLFDSIEYALQGRLLYSYKDAMYKYNGLSQQQKYAIISCDIHVV